VEAAAIVTDSATIRSTGNCTLVIAEHGSPAVKRTENDSGTDCQYARCEASRSHGGGDETSGCRRIRYRHGHIEVLDRPESEQRVCECYAVVKRKFGRLLPDLKVL
jgi:hypothetical protein